MKNIVGRTVSEQDRLENLDISVASTNLMVAIDEASTPVSSQT